MPGPRHEERITWRRELTRHPRHGPLPLLLLVLTVVTGLVDAVSIVSLGHVFVANMTGNVVFSGFALAGAPGFSLVASLVALAAFLIGAGVGGVVVGRREQHRAVLLRTAAAVEALLLAGAAVIAATRIADPLVTDVTLAIAAIALGVQNATVRGLGVPDLTTTVLTLTLTGIAADLRKRDLRVAGRRALSVMSMLGGAMIGALIDIHVDASAALAAATALTTAVAIWAARSERESASWHGRPVTS